jgi:hypothetical protein
VAHDIGVASIKNNGICNRLRDGARAGLRQGWGFSIATNQGATLHLTRAVSSTEILYCTSVELATLFFQPFDWSIAECVEATEQAASS